MKDPEKNRTIRRILVALDASTHCRSALETAIDIASCLEAEIEGIFVEDIDLLRLASLPFAREVAYTSAQERTLDGPQMERALKARAAEIRQSLMAAAQDRNIPYSFRVVRGHAVTEVLALSLETDLLIFWNARRKERRPLSPAATSKALYSVIRTQGSEYLRFPVLAVYDGSECALRALLIATHLARLGSNVLVVFIPVDSEDSYAGLQKRLLEDIGEQDVWLHFRKLPHNDYALLARLLGEEEGILVIDDDNPLVREDKLGVLLKRSRCPILVVR